MSKLVEPGLRQKWQEISNLYQKAQAGFDLAKTTTDFQKILDIMTEANQQYNLQVKPAKSENSKPFGGDQEVADLVLSKLESAIGAPKIVIALLELFISVLLESEYYAEKAGKKIAKEMSRETISDVWKKAKSTGSYRDIVKVIRKVFENYPKSRLLFNKIVAGFIKIGALITFLSGAAVTGVYVLLMPSKLGGDDDKPNEYYQLLNSKYAADRAMSNAFERLLNEKIDKDCMGRMMCHLVPLRQPIQTGPQIQSRLR